MSIITHPLTLSGLACLAVALPLASATAQQNSQARSVYIEQAPGASVEATQIGAPQARESASKVYFPDAITAQSVAQARARAAQQQQLEQAASSGGGVAQLANGDDGARDVDQLSDGQSGEALAQLTQEERQVLLEAVEGTDICERSPDIPALRALCEGRIENRSSEFAQSSQGASAEDALLGGQFDSERLATLEAAINRLAQSSGRPDDFADQAIASVALGQQAALSDTQATAAEGDPTSELSPETQAVVNAIVQQLGGGG